MKKPVIDLHCDLLSYLTLPNSSINNTDEIGCAIPYLKDGNVKMQTMAIFAPTEANSHEFGIKQSEIFKNLNLQDNELYLLEKQHLASLNENENIGMIAALESGSAFCDEHIPLKEGFKNLQTIIDNVGHLFYISFTHHAENRFGGGNYATAGLKDDGKELVEFLDKKNIAIDLSHTSDSLAYGILEHISKENVDVSVIASHSNYRAVYDHPRNLPDDIAKEIILKNGLIGVNFLRDFVNPDRAEALLDHIEHGLSLNGQNAVCYGVDYFYTGNNPDTSRLPFYFKEHENAGCYPEINELVKDRFGDDICAKLSSQNVIDFLGQLWR